MNNQLDHFAEIIQNYEKQQKIMELMQYSSGRQRISTLQSSNNDSPRRLNNQLEIFDSIHDEGHGGVQSINHSRNYDADSSTVKEGQIAELRVLKQFIETPRYDQMDSQVDLNQHYYLMENESFYSDKLQQNFYTFQNNPNLQGRNGKCEEKTKHLQLLPLPRDQSSQGGGFLTSDRGNVGVGAGCSTLREEQPRSKQGPPILA